MKLADLLSVAKNIPLSSFDWGHDAVMFLNSRLPDGQSVDITGTGTDAYSKLISLNADKMMALLSTEITISGNRLLVTEMVIPTAPYDPTLITPPTVPATSIAPNTTVNIGTVEKDKTETSLKWPLYVACLLVAMLVGFTIIATADVATENQKGNRDVANSGLQLITEVIKAISNNPPQESPYDDPATTSQPPPEESPPDPNSFENIDSTQQQPIDSAPQPQ